MCTACTAHLTWFCAFGRYLAHIEGELTRQRSEAEADARVRGGADGLRAWGGAHTLLTPHRDAYTAEA